MKLLIPELSPKSPYWIPRHRYYELKHFCLQYPTWRKVYEHLNALSARPYDIEAIQKSGVSDPTAKIATSKAYFSARTRMIFETAEETDTNLARYILHAVTEGLSYDILEARYEIPCSRAEYYKLYRKFFWLLDKKRG